MIRIRRYRLFLLVAVLAIVSVFHLYRVNGWNESALESFLGLKPDADGTSLPDFNPLPKPVHVPEQPAGPAVYPPPLPPLQAESQRGAASRAPDTTATQSTTSLDSSPTVTGEEFLAKQPSFDQEFGEYGEGRYEVKPRPPDEPRAYWRPPPEHFPVPSHSLISVPTGEPRSLPKVQYNFGRESSSKKADRVRKQTAIREAFKHAWSGYKNHSLPHDELKPISKEVGDPFNGWGATLVDSLDTLWIMGLRDEFEEAVGAVGKIDFKTSARKDIPLFETTIRYLGGLIAAYDLSSGTYPILLDKAVELADILMGAFDTPNRMPAVYYNWAPSYASQPHRASAHTVLAELGSLSVEFTRLAQITKEHKYYDAVARVTDALEKWQMATTLPGLWPLKLDASGCKKPEVVRNVAGSEQFLPDGVEESEESSKPFEKDGIQMEGSDSLKKRQENDSSMQKKDASKADVSPAAPEKKVEPVAHTEWEDDYANVDCEPQGLNTEPHSTTHTYGIGAMADSTYEYFPKEYALLGGLNPQYKTMYLDAMEVVREELLFRPMTKDNHDILFLAKQSIAPKATNPAKRKVTTYEGTHLGCFAGGMFALGAKMFDIPGDMAIAEKLTDGCVWAYGSTTVGIMAEEFELVPCDSLTSCKWDESKWHDALDPRLEERIRAVEAYNLNQQRLQEEAAANVESLMKDGEDDAVVSDPSTRKRDATAEPDDDHEAAPANLIAQSFVPRVPLSHEKFVATRIQEERLPPGYTKIKARDYRLRPEAIESVFIMYRTTGDDSWRQKGWAMFDAVDRATKTEVANAGVDDVTSQLMEQRDTMESFWLAETLKYYYLLFCEPNFISLDDYVLNTEAHPFKRPK
ncbi:uncharacterized protein Z518_09803 [Rhinocladiella mackenziei CBS 650.93]|uniref:alpha-1,2-Mannosidase n=1 Tax=Rhinocladiella mackenziei CBS 650.93 TaxID=1442369 RepID=A0A0D2GQZ4_9EURO|nr:uncharacterized protein Z518_09803 [Rhinocladiella mackenziei CBS 650.93]KIX00738.1 hypothetical protein Z518_09803 [Rhinocladiella mackenziei CBS 650.93]